MTLAGVPETERGLPDADCEKACAEAYTAQVGHCTDVLRDNLSLAKTDEETRLAKDRFAHCMALAKKTKVICLETCSE